MFGGERVPGYYVSNMANERLKWETTEQWNAGLDLGFFEDRIKVTADWYDKVTRDLLLYALLPASSGFEQGMLNIGKIRNRGFELSGSWSDTIGDDFRYTVSGNLTTIDNEVLTLGKTYYQGDKSVAVSEPASPSVISTATRSRASTRTRPTSPRRRKTRWRPWLRAT